MGPHNILCLPVSEELTSIFIVIIQHTRYNFALEKKYNNSLFLKYIQCNILFIKTNKTDLKL